MLALRRSRCTPLNSLRPFSIRTFRTVPRRIPTFIKKWDPTLHKSTRQHEVKIKPPIRTPETRRPDTTAVAKQDALREETWAKLRNGDHSAAILERHSRLKHVLHLATTTGKITIPSLRTAVWRAYRLAKSADKSLLSVLSDSDWNILWASQTFQSFENTKRTLHLEELFGDMTSAGCNPTVTQRAEYLECLFLNGKEYEAVEGWEADHVRIEGLDGKNYPPEHLEVGARLYALAGLADRAREIMYMLFERYPDWNSSVMVLVLRTHTSADLTKYHNHAKDIYDKRRSSTSPKMTLRDYDACFVGFLEARHVYYAKAVFGDMVKDGFLATNDAPEEVEKVMERLHKLYRLGTEVPSMTAISIDAIEVLPKSYHAHLFGQWLKLTVVKQMPEASAQILDSMYKRGYTPETYHFNMLLKALFRTNETPNVLKAENIGWRMADKSRKAHKRTIRGSDAGHSSTQEAARNLPAADVTTFSLIMQHHAKRSQWEYVDYLSRQLKETSIVPNAIIMNVLIDNKVRQGAYAEAWAIYQQLTQRSKRGERTGVFPDGATIRLLWKTLRFALGDKELRDDPKLPSPRELLKESLEWWNQCRYRYDADRFRTGLSGVSRGAISSLILHCFSYTQDIAGSLVAMHALRRNLDIFPADNDANILHRQLAWVDMSRESSAVGEQYFQTFSRQENEDRVTEVYHILLEARFKRIGEEKASRMTDEEVGDFSLNMLSELARVYMKRQYPAEVVEQMIEQAKRDVGFIGGTGDLDASQVL
jgi:hypothetical protein